MPQNADLLAIIPESQFRSGTIVNSKNIAHVGFAILTVLVFSPLVFGSVHRFLGKSAFSP
jgi:hypothetical protein